MVTGRRSVPRDADAGVTINTTLDDIDVVGG
jgi:hypothetical protein